jgi:hypothetical protein
MTAEEIAEAQRRHQSAYAAKHPERRKATYAKYYSKNKDKIKDRIQGNIEHHRLVKRTYRKKKLLSDVNFKLRTNLGIRISQLVSGKSKSASTMNLVGCSVEDLKGHLQSLFTEGMHWNNYGKKGWTIDHICPCASFDLLDPAEQEKCFHYTNLQPLWFVDNCRKSNKLQEAI